MCAHLFYATFPTPQNEETEKSAAERAAAEKTATEKALLETAAERAAAQAKTKKKVKREAKELAAPMQAHPTTQIFMVVMAVLLSACAFASHTFASASLNPAASRGHSLPEDLAACLFNSHYRLFHP